MNKYYLNWEVGKCSFDGIVGADEIDVISNSIVLKIDGKIVACYPSDKTVIKNLEVKQKHSLL